jgi:hypothetical protein
MFTSQDYARMKARVAERKPAPRTFSDDTARAISCAPLSTDDRAAFRATLADISDLTTTR